MLVRQGNLRIAAAMALALSASGANAYSSSRVESLGNEALDAA